MSHKILLLFLLGFVALALSAPATTEEELSPAAQDETKDEPLQEDDEQLSEAEETEKDDEEANQVFQGEEDEETQEEPEDDSEGGTENDENPGEAENEVAEVEKDENVPEKRHHLYRSCHRVCRRYRYCKSFLFIKHKCHYKYHCYLKCSCKVKYYHCRYRRRCVWRYKYYHGKPRRYRHCYRYCYRRINASEFCLLANFVREVRKACYGAQKAGMLLPKPRGLSCRDETASSSSVFFQPEISETSAAAEAALEPFQDIEETSALGQILPSSVDAVRLMKA
ncbi:predicted protein [Nematostella vectensis]|uniref:Uncharacterized protein n=1 Tax=Nematostella vectensis TaxID=45351 RepID=A7SXY5_NEMVE|nr:predicted protein [Nematostella vectensis]|eukprot:XP_001623539.1 predicted protein [Nematostella vectensis]